MMSKIRRMTRHDCLMMMYRHDFIAFAIKAFELVYPGQKLAENWHLEIIAHELHNCLRGKQKRLSIHAPPRSLKSFLASVAFPAFALGRDPRRKVMSIVANQELAGDLCTQLCRLLSSDFYRTLFPHTQFERKRNAIVLAHGGSFISSPFFSSPIGRGADILIVDDPVSPADARNGSFNRKAAEWFVSDVIPRLNKKAGSIAILVMQRVARDDLATAFFKGQPRTALIFTAVARKQERWRMPNGTLFIREPRTVLNPQLETLEDLYATYRSMHYRDFVCQYLQDPDAYRWVNCHMYYEFDTTDWTPEKGEPERHFLFSNNWYIQYECFGVGPKPPYLCRDPLTPEQRNELIEYSQALLWKEMQKDLEDM